MAANLSVVRSTSRGWNAAEFSRRLKNWIPTQAHVNALLTGEAWLLLARSRDIIRNNGLCKRAKSLQQAYVVGPGVVPAPRVKDNGLRNQLVDTWQEWVEEADSEGCTNFYGLQRLAEGERFEGGESFIRLRYRRTDAKMSVPLQLQVLGAEMCPFDRITYPLQGGNTPTPEGNNEVRAGIEFNMTNGRRRAYWFFRQHPGDTTIVNRDANLFVRVPADQVIHLFEPELAGQIRGIPRLVQTIVRIWVMDQYDDAELDRKKVMALLCAAIVTPDIEDAGKIFGEPDDQDISLSEQLKSDISLEPGNLFMLLPGQDIREIKPATTDQQYDVWMKRMLMAIASGLDLPYSALSNDYEAASYSSMRMSLLNFRQTVESFQKTVLAPMCYQKIWRAWLEQAVLAGRLPQTVLDPATKALYPRWIFPKWQTVDAFKEYQAEKLAVDSYFKPRSDVQAEEGWDPDELQEILEVEAERKKQLVEKSMPEQQQLPGAGPGGDVGGTRPERQPKPKPKPNGAQRPA